MSIMHHLNHATDNFNYQYIIQCSIFYFFFIFEWQFTSTVDFLVQLYIEGETTYCIEDEEKLTSVEVKRKKFTLSKEAIDCFQKIHDEWELNVCKKYPHDALVGG